MTENLRTFNTSLSAVQHFGKELFPYVVRSVCPTGFHSCWNGCSTFGGFLLVLYFQWMFMAYELLLVYIVFPQLWGEAVAVTKVIQPFFFIFQFIVSLWWLTITQNTFLVSHDVDCPFCVCRQHQSYVCITFRRSPTEVQHLCFEEHKQSFMGPAFYLVSFSTEHCWIKERFHPKMTIQWWPAHHGVIWGESTKQRLDFVMSGAIRWCFCFRKYHASITESFYTKWNTHPSYHIISLSIVCVY